MNRRVKNIVGLQFGVKIGREMRNSVDAEKHDCDMTLTPAGVLVRKKGQLDLIIPYAHAGNGIELYPEEDLGAIANELANETVPGGFTPPTAPADPGPAHFEHDIGSPDGSFENAKVPPPAKLVKPKPAAKKK
jgi:hypothetical protein